MAKWSEHKRGKVEIGFILGGGAHCTLSKMVLNVVNSGPKSSFPGEKGWDIKRREFEIGLILGGGAH